MNKLALKSFKYNPMWQKIKFVILFLYVIGLISCQKQAEQKEYYIISKKSYTDFAKRYVYDSVQNLPPPPRPEPPIVVVEGTKYSDLVIILDSIDNVFIYRTELFPKIDIQKKKIELICGTGLRFDKIHPEFINLKPEQLIKFSATEFSKFINSNKNIFKVDSNRKQYLYIASTKDTVYNPCLDEFKKVFKKQKNLFYVIRKTTEEEEVVLKFVKNKKAYNAMKHKWSNHFLHGVIPFSQEYKSDSTLNCKYARKAKNFVF